MTALLPPGTDLAPIERVRAAQVAIMDSGHAVMPEAVHTFAPHLYVRGLPMVAGLGIIGRQHKTAHLLQVVYGTVLIDNGDGPVEVTGFTTLETAPGTKRAIYAVTDAYLQTLHVTDTTDLAALEHELLEPEPDLPRMELPQ